MVSTLDIALQAKARLEKGEDFAKLAEELSEDPGSKSAGGDLGWFPRGQMVKEFEDAAFTLQVNQVSQPITTTFGVHLIQVLARDSNRPLDDAMLERKKSQAFETWLETIVIDPNAARIERFYKDEYVPAEVKKAISQLGLGTQ